ncbi:MAG: methylated-DNA--[protein]-cysteine S-methyltransferase [Candidatus Binataceae bacterium]|nr:methylated-DNA--[protein]-cysteine S-methyltransferase [Candidatus Binataceae bacterium]
MKIVRQPAKPIARSGIVNSAVGRLLVALSDRGIVLIQFLDGAWTDCAAAEAALSQHFQVTENAAAVAVVGAEIRRFADGDLNALTMPVDLTLVSSPFRLRVLETLRGISPGTVISYQALAAAAGAPRASRAVGTTMAANPVPIYVPCHRVIRADGSIGNYGGGALVKLKLLRAEGVRIDSDIWVCADSGTGSDAIDGRVHFDRKLRDSPAPPRITE